MNYQILLENYASGSEITKDELSLLSIELDAQIANVKISPNQACMQVAPKYICIAALVCEASTWIVCLAAILDKCSPPLLGQKAKVTAVFEALNLPR